jgi:hypothetical protein
MPGYCTVGALIEVLKSYDPTWPVDVAIEDRGQSYYATSLTHAASDSGKKVVLLIPELPSRRSWFARLFRSKCKSFKQTSSPE